SSTKWLNGSDERIIQIGTRESAAINQQFLNGTISSRFMAGRLFVVSTPIGNLEDITLRALNTLKNVALIAAEDTRRTGLLLRHFGLATPATSLHEHNERQKVPHLLAKLEAGSDI